MSLGRSEPAPPDLRDDTVFVGTSAESVRETHFELAD
jgi:hypothetical protein